MVFLFGDNMCMYVNYKYITYIMLLNMCFKRKYVFKKYYLKK